MSNFEVRELATEDRIIKGREETTLFDSIIVKIYFAVVLYIFLNTGVLYIFLIL